ncbi:MAG: protein translocase subunit SecF [Candidatus Sericytochromatia bacterium]|nr:protein translocase subunit SecF [Candidatus Sericytochromatia bacterium]
MAMRFEDSSFNFMNKKSLWFLISTVLLTPGFLAIVYLLVTMGTPLKLGIDFTGGTLAQLTFEKAVTAQSVKAIVSEAGHPDAQVQIADEKTALIRTKAISSEERQKLLDKVQQKMGTFKADRFESVGPTIGKELLANSLSAVAFTLIGIVLYVTFRYQFDFAMCAIAALVHDVIFLVGVFALLGIGLGVEVDSLFVTAVLTVVGFSVHDTIVIYDRIRENMRTAGKRDTFDDVANRSIKQTLARSINTSVTTCLTLLALLILGGDTVRWFVLAMLLGIAVGTYSSIFNASQLLSVWRMMGVKRTA